MKRTRSMLLALSLTVVGCTPQEHAIWLEWYASEPAVATAYAVRLLQPEPFVPIQPEPVWTQWDTLAECESGGNWSINTGNGYYGGLQFALQSWRAVGGSGYPHHASKDEQINRAEKLLAIQGWKAWPGCTRKLGWR